MLVVRFPTVPTALLACTFQANLAEASVSSENSHPLVVSKKSLIILELKARVRLKKFSQQIIVAPLHAVLAVRTVTGLFLILHNLRITLVYVQLALIPSV